MRLVASGSQLRRDDVKKQTLKSVKDLVLKSDLTTYELSSALGAVYTNALWIDWGFASFKTFLDDIGIHYRKAMALVQVDSWLSYGGFTHDDCRKLYTELGWSKLYKLCGFVNVEALSADDLVKAYKNVTVSNLAGKSIDEHYEEDEEDEGYVMFSVRMKVKERDKFLNSLSNPLFKLNRDKAGRCTNLNKAMIRMAKFTETVVQTLKETVK